jgi:hypothetical protein
MRLMPDAESPDAEEEELFIHHLDQHAKHDGSSEKVRPTQIQCAGHRAPAHSLDLYTSTKYTQVQSL